MPVTRPKRRAEPDLASLNPEQRAAVRTTEGPVLVLAGAGTGKTRVITVRMAHLLAKGIAASHVLAMTFTNKAAREMRERVGSLTDRDAASGLTVGTFHSFCARTLRTHAAELDLPKTFSIADASDQQSIVRGVLRDLHVAEATLHPRAALARISLFKNKGHGPEAVLDGAVDASDELVGRTYRKYEEALRRSRTLDFDDLLLFTVKLLSKSEATRVAFADRFRYVMVDEYQDTNGPQYEIVRLIAGRHRNLCVVGDDDQSIYGWRGADVKKILNFERDFPGAKVVRLETNYRSTRPILDAANRVIRNNVARHEKSLSSARGEGDPLLVYQAADEEDEADFVVRSIVERTSRRHERFGDFAILFRTQTQPRAFEARLRASNLPYVVVGGQSFFDRKEVRDLLAYLKLVANPMDEASLLRIVNTPPRGIGKTTVERIDAFAAEKGISAAEAFRRVEEIDNIPKTAARAATDLARFLDSLAPMAEGSGEGLVALVQKLVRGVDYKAEVERCYPDAAAREARWAGVVEVMNFAENHVRRVPDATLTGFLEELSLSANDDKTSEDPSRRNAVTLMTVHAAKGLEYPTVYLVGCEEGLLPHHRSVEEDTVDEERRLAYVGITRAKDRLTLTLAEERAKYGTRVSSTPSRFLFELLEVDLSKMTRDGELPDRLPERHPSILLARHDGRMPSMPSKTDTPPERKPGPFSGRPFKGRKKS